MIRFLALGVPRCRRRCRRASSCPGRRRTCRGVPAVRGCCQGTCRRTRRRPTPRLRHTRVADRPAAFRHHASPSARRWTESGRSTGTSATTPCTSRGNTDPPIRARPRASRPNSTTRRARNADAVSIRNQRRTVHGRGGQVHPYANARDLPHEPARRCVLPPTQRL